MESVIREGALRLLTTESSCDVILSCQGHRLMAHKLILSMASPVFKVLLEDDASDHSVVIFPDVTPTTMSFILDYIYTGCTVVYPDTINEFVSLAGYLKIHLDLDIDDLSSSKIFQENKMNLSHKEEMFTSHMVEQMRVLREKFEKDMIRNKNDINDNIFEKQDQKLNEDLLKSKENRFRSHELDPSDSYSTRIRLRPHQEHSFGRNDSRNITDDTHDTDITTNRIKFLEKSETDIETNKIYWEAQKDVVNKYHLLNFYNKHVENLVTSRDPLLDTGKKESVYSKRNRRKLPNLLPININRSMERINLQRKLCRYVLPSPWSTRTETVFGDPRDDRIDTGDNSLSPTINLRKAQENDSNNNFQPETYSGYNFSPLTQPQEPTKSYTASNYPHELYSKAPLDLYLLNKKGIASSNATATNNEIEKFTKLALINPVISDNNDKINKSTVSEENIILPNIPISDNTESTKEERVSSNESTRDCVSNTSCDDSSSTKIKQKFDKEKPFKCEDCGKGFSQMRNYKYHRSVHEGTKEFAAKCTECGKTFNDRGYLSSHMKIHRDKKEYACPHCPKRFNQRVAYNMHLRIHTGVKPHECTTCGKSFSRKMLLKQHQRVHTGERPYSCPECGKTFADRSNMSLHARLHTGVKPYACTLCPKSFTKKHHLKTHMNFHTGLKPYTCDGCGLAFSQSSNMRTHRKKCLLKQSTIPNTKTGDV